MYSFILYAGMLAMLPIPHSESGTRFPFTENFDAVLPPGLPPGWTSSQNRSPGTNDFTSTASTPRSVPNALISTNATIGQSVVSPEFDFRDILPDSMIFFTRRSSSHLAPVVLEASADGGLTFPIAIGDTLTNPGHSDYTRNAMPLPDTLSALGFVRFRWRVIADLSGSTGTLRIDDIAITVKIPEDLTVSRISISPAIPAPTEPISVTVQIANVGRESVSDFTTALFLDRNRDSVAASGEEVGSLTMAAPVEPEDSVDLVFTIAPLSTGGHNLIAVVSGPDGNPSNDTLLTAIQVRHVQQALVINEIMFGPSAGVGEYIELFNPGVDSMDIGGWLIKDRPGAGGTANEFAFPGSPVKCPPGGFVVLAEDSSVTERFPYLFHGSGVVVLFTGGTPGLNNDGDDVVLLDRSGAVIDSVPYLPAWHHPEVIDPGGRSLEKVSPLLTGADARNWSTSVDGEGGTPGRQNSLYVPVRSESTELTLSPNPFSPDGDGRDDLTVIAFETPPGSSTFSLRIYDIEGRLIRRLATNELTGPRGTVVWDGLDDQQRKARIGMYVVYLEILSVNGGIRDARKGVVVLAGRL